jgi:P4 family phage/plasmid primase-like protien
MVDLASFLARFQIDKGGEHTHTSIARPSGAFYIPVDHSQEFFDLYKKSLARGDDLHLTEKHRDISPILIDLDFRWKTTECIRRFTDKDIEEITMIYSKRIFEYVDTDKIDAYVMVKKGPVTCKDVVKDGIHIVIPNVVTVPAVQFLIRKHVVSDCKHIFDRLQVSNSSEDIIDEAVISKNNWQMYGSKKLNSDVYKVVKHLQISSDLQHVDLEVVKDDSSFVELFSIRNKYHASKIKFEKIEEIKTEQERSRKSKKTMMDKSMFQLTKNLRQNTYEDLATVKQLLNILKPERASVYSDWIRVGWCLRTIDYRLLESWIAFSKQSDKFKDGECEKMWNYMREDGLSMGTLYMWAKTDNPEAFKLIEKKDMSNLIYNSLNESHYDIASVVHYMFKYDFVCASIKLNQWYEFRNHRWMPCDSGHKLRSKISTQVYKEYMTAAAQWANKASLEEDENAQKACSEKSKKFSTIALKLKQTNFKENIMKECRELFFIEKFEEKLDSSSNLIGFENGIFDLNTHEFRDGRPEDFLSFTTKINYVPYDPASETARNILDFLSKVLTKEHIRDYVLKVLASFLNGGVKEERFHIWTGSGSNGKSKTIDLFEQAFGDYCCKLPITLLTAKRAASNAATSEIARTKGKRFACLQEPSEDEKLNVGLMKELTGGDKIQARMIYKEPIEFKPQFKMILTCNTLPNVPSDDGGTWRRIRVVEFTSKFCESPNPDNPNEFLIDKDLSEKFDAWKEMFMSMLIEHYKTYQTKGIVEPEEVLKCTRDYQKNNDNYLEFIEKELEKHDTGVLTYTEFLGAFKLWCKEMNLQLPSAKPKEIKNSLKATLGECVKIGKSDGWRGWRFKPLCLDDEL